MIGISKIISMNDLSDRLFSFAVRCIKLVRVLPTTIEYRVINNQLIKSSSSAGANYEESQAGSSKADFNNKVRIALREMKESDYWLRILKDIDIPESKNNELDLLIQESKELKNILGVIVQKTRQQK